MARAISVFGIIADWVVGQRQNSSVGVGMGIFGGGYHAGSVGLGVGQTMAGGCHDRVLRLTSGAENKRVSWSGNY